MASFDNLSDLPLKQFRLIPFDFFPGKFNMAIDYHLSINCQRDDIPILRFYGWMPYCVSTGYHQNNEIIDFKKLENDGVDFVQRPTGGRAILHAEELTYSVIVPRRSVDHRLLYRFIHQLFVNALRSLGYPVMLKSDNEKLGALTHHAEDFPCFTKSAQTEVQYENKKLIGSAQRIFPNAILQHGSLLIGNEHADLPSYLNVDRKTKNAIKSEISEKTICLKNIKKNTISPENIIDSVITQLELARSISVNFEMINDLNINSLENLQYNVQR